jgi:hypothetical protein
MEISYDFGDNMGEMVKKFGDRIVYEHALDNMVIALQGMCRAKMKKQGKDRVADATIIAAVKNWKPGGRVIDPTKRVGRITRDVSKLDDKAKKALMAQLQRDLEGKKPVLRKAPKVETPVAPSEEQTTNA